MFEFGFEIGFREGINAFFSSEGGLEGDEIFDVFRVVRNFNGESFFREGVMAGAGSLGHVAEDVFF